MNGYIVIGFFLSLYSEELSNIVSKFRYLPLFVLFIVPFISLTTPTSIHFSSRSTSHPFTTMMMELGGIIWIIVILFFVRAYCNTDFNAKLFHYLNNSAYSIYLTHNISLFTLALIVQRYTLSLWQSWSIVQFGSLVMCLMFYHLCNCHPILKFLMGMNTKSDQPPKRATTLTEVLVKK